VAKAMVSQQTTIYTGTISGVDPSSSTVTVTTVGGTVQVLVDYVSPYFRWPNMGETWMIRKENGTWRLVGIQLDPSYNNLQPGEGEVNSGLTQDIAGNQFVTINTTELDNGDSVSYDAATNSFIGAPPASGYVPVGGNSYIYTYSIILANGDPGTGLLRMNSTSPSGTTAIYINEMPEPSGSTSIGEFLAQMTPGIIKLFQFSNPANYIIFNLTGVIPNAPYYQLGVIYVASEGTLDTTAGDLVFNYTANSLTDYLSPLAYNLVSNPSYEYDLPYHTPLDWSGTADSGTISTFTVISGVTAYSGQHVAQFTVSGMTNNSQCLAYTSTGANSVIVGETYSLGAYINPISFSGTGTNATVSVNWYSGSTLISTIQSGAITSIGNWQLASVTAEAPAGATQATLAVSVNTESFSGGGSIYIDAAMFTQAPLIPPYFDGDTFGCGWIGVSGNSYSVVGVGILGGVLAGNLPDPSFSTVSGVFGPLQAGVISGTDAALTSPAADLTISSGGIINLTVGYTSGGRVIYITNIATGMLTPVSFQPTLEALVPSPLPSSGKTMIVGVEAGLDGQLYVTSGTPFTNGSGNQYPISITGVTNTPATTNNRLRIADVMVYNNSGTYQWGFSGTATQGVNWIDRRPWARRARATLIPTPSLGYYEYTGNQAMTAIDVTNLSIRLECSGNFPVRQTLTATVQVGASTDFEPGFLIDGVSVSPSTQVEGGGPGIYLPVNVVYEAIPSAGSHLFQAGVLIASYTNPVYLYTAPNTSLIYTVEEVMVGFANGTI
jgi:hypothetical protein